MPVITADHPRACGANAALAARCSARIGSSPRMRGKPKADAGDVETRRIIPAHAGQTRALARPDQRRTDHPRACGANALPPTPRTLQHGSSPRMRGKLGGCSGFSCFGRIIPAHAGQTAIGTSFLYAQSDHPRACGANNVASALETVVSGSSPRMRGKLRDFGCDGRGGRIIPAHAGQTPNGSHTPQ